MSEATLLKEVKGLLVKIERSKSECEHLKIEAGNRLLKLHARCHKKGTPWKRYLQDNLSIGSSYAYDLMKCARGAQTVREMLDNTKARVAKHRKNKEETVRYVTDTCDTGCDYDPDADVEGEAPEVSRRRGNLWRMQVTAEDAARIKTYYLENPSESDNQVFQAALDAADAWADVRDFLKKQLKPKLTVVK
jgi:hypothetical protein